MIWYEQEHHFVRQPAHIKAIITGTFKNDQIQITCTICRGNDSQCATLYKRQVKNLLEPTIEELQERFGSRIHKVQQMPFKHLLTTFLAQGHSAPELFKGGFRCADYGKNP